jgi:sugar lactone lactonase YvrE
MTKPNERVELFCDVGNIVGESIIWDGANRRLLWVDLVGKSVFMLNCDADGRALDTGPKRVDVSELATSIGFASDGRAVLGRHKSVCLWDFDKDFQTRAIPEPDLPGNRLNEGVVAPDGSFWVGTMQNNVAPDGSPSDITASTGSLYRITADGGCTRLTDDQFGVTNTFVWTDDNRVVTADTLTNTLFTYDFADNGCALTNRQVLLADYPRGLPDGSTRDTEGGIWNCRVVGGNCVIRILPDGTIDRVIELPCSWPTSCTFGGDELDILYITSARFTLSDDHLAANPQEGAVFAIKPGFSGKPANVFDVR